MIGICPAGTRKWTIRPKNSKPMNHDEFAAKHPKELQQMIEAGLDNRGPLDKMSFSFRGK